MKNIIENILNTNTEKNVIVLIGLQGSGKSTFAKELLLAASSLEKPYELLSSDKIRKEYPDFSNEEVFKLLYKKANQLLKEGSNLIIDATNITRKSRAKILQGIRQPANFLAVVMATSFNKCLKRAHERNASKNTHYVPEEVIKKYLLSFEIVLPSEGFKDAVFICDNDNSEIEDIISQTKGYEQKSKYHDYTLDKHMYLVTEKIKSLTSDKVLELAASLHDIGKVLTQTFDEEGNAHYYGHANAGAYYITSSIPYLMQKENLSASEILRLISIVNYHMLPYQWETEKARNKWRLILKEVYDDLLIFNQADKGGKES